MSTAVATPSTELAHDLAQKLNRCFESLTVPPDLFTPDAFFDLLPPFWRFQIQGPATFEAQLRAITQAEVSSRIRRVLPTSTGFVLEHEETRHGPKPETARRVWICDVRDGRIDHAICYCNGGWDDELRARHAAEAPMLRP